MENYYLQAWIDRSAIAHNVRILQQCARGRKFCVAIKANAYGHDVRIVLPVLREAKVDMLAVASLEEARELRELAWENPILVLGSEFSVYESGVREELGDEIVANGYRITVTRAEDAAILSRAGVKQKKTVQIHLALDTGMSRMGLNGENLWELIRFVRSLPNIAIEGLYTHFATADCADKGFAHQQLKHFVEFRKRLESAGIAIPIFHAANSGATVDLPESHFDMVRAGISVYGYPASDEMHNKPELRPALKLVSYLTLVKTIEAGSFVGYGCTFQTKRATTIGLVPIGYADGYFRELSNRGQMLVSGQAVRVIGRVSMDQTIVDLTDVVGVGVTCGAGQEVVIYDNHRESPNSVEAVARLLNTIPYVVTTSLGRRVKRVAVF